MTLEEFLLPKESVKYTCPEEVEYEGSTYNLYITNIRLMLHSTKGKLFKKQRIVSERLLEIQNLDYSEDTLAVETPKKKMDIVGRQHIIKEILKELQKSIKISENEALIHARLYMDKTLVENEMFARSPFARSLTRQVWEEGSKCCVCGDPNVRIWILDFLPAKNGLAIFTRVYCKEHEKRWKKFEMLKCKLINAVMILDMPHLNPVERRIYPTWEDFICLLGSYIDSPKAEISQEVNNHMTRNAHLVLKDRIDEFLKSGKK